MAKLEVRRNCQKAFNAKRTTTRVSGTLGSLKGFVIVLIILVQVCNNCEGASRVSFNLLSSQSVWKLSIKYSVFAGGWLARTISGKSIPVFASNPVTIPWTSPEVNSNSELSYYKNGTKPRATSPIPKVYGNVTKSNQSSDVHRPHGPWRYRRMNSEHEKLRKELLKQIKSLDHMKCFPKVLCGLSVDSSKSASGIDAQVVKNYIKLMKSAKPEDDSNEEGRPGRDNTKDALSLFLMKSGIIKDKTKSGENSGSTSSSDEEYEDVGSEESPAAESPEYKTAFERNRDQLEDILLSKRILATGTHGNKTHHNFKDDNFSPSHNHPLLYIPNGRPSIEGGSSSASKIGSTGSSWVPWVSFSLGTDSFEKDPFFTPGTKNSKDSNKNNETWQKDFDNMAYLMKLKQAVDRRRKKATLKKRQGLPSNHAHQARALKDDEMVIYATAVDIGQKLKDPKQCDYLYNGCPIPYSDIIKIISSIRKEIKQDDETIETLSQEMFETGPEVPVPRRTSVRKPSVKKVRKPKPKVSQSSNTRKSAQAPMTKISHTLPNGEKVEINVQVSGKHDLHVDDQEFEDERPQEEEDDTEDGYTFQEEENIPEEEVVEEAALSASYELDDEMQDDFRKPTPLEIFKKVSLTATDEPVQPIAFATSPRYPVTTKPKTLRTTTKKPTPPTTKKPSTTKKPPTTRKSPTTKRRSTTARTPAPSRRPTKPYKMPTVKPRAKHSTTAKPPRRKQNKRPTTVATTTKRTTKVTTTATIRTKRPSTRSTTTLRPSRRTTKRVYTTKVPYRRRKPSVLTEAFEYVPITTPSPTSSADEESTKTYSTVPTTTKKPKKVPTSTEPALAMFTTTTNFMTDFIVQELSTTERFTKPLYSSLAPVINRYSLFKKSKPGMSFKNSSGSSVETDPEMSSVHSLEYGSSEINIYSHEGSHFIITRDDPQKVTTTTVEPKLFAKPSKRKPTSGSNTASSGTTANGKRIIKYKNAKLPHLVLMTAPLLDSPNPMDQLESFVTITGNRRGAKPSPKPLYSLSLKKPSNKNSSVDYPPPQVYNPDTGSPEEMPWSPEQ